MRARSDWFLSDSSGLVTVRVRWVRGYSTTWMVGPCRPRYFLSLWSSSQCGSGQFRGSLLPVWLVHAVLGIFCLWPSSQCGSGEFRDALLPGWLVHAALGIFCLSGPRHSAGQVSSGMLYYLDGWSMPPSVFSVSLAPVTLRIKSIWWCQCSGSGSTGSTCFWASRIRILLSSCKNLKKNLDSFYFVTLLDFLSLKNDVNVPSKSNKQKKLC
jgi:hypothetical protein